MFAVVSFRSFKTSNCRFILGYFNHLNSNRILSSKWLQLSYQENPANLRVLRELLLDGLSKMNARDASLFVESTLPYLLYSTKEATNSKGEEQERYLVPLRAYSTKRSITDIILFVLQSPNYAMGFANIPSEILEQQLTQLINQNNKVTKFIFPSSKDALLT